MRTRLLVAVSFVFVTGCAAQESACPRVVSCPKGNITLDDSTHAALWSAGKPVNGLSVTELKGEHGYAIVFRRDGEIVVGAMTPDKTPVGGLVTIAQAAHASDPIMAPSGEGVVIAWSEQADAESPWHVRWARWTPGTKPAASDSQVVPPPSKTPPQLAWAADNDPDGRDLIARE